MRSLLAFLFGAFSASVIHTATITYQPVSIIMPPKVSEAEAQAWASFFLRDGVYFDMVKQCKQ